MLEIKLPKLGHSFSSAEAAAAADDVGIVNAFSGISSHPSLIFIFFSGGPGTGRESTTCVLLVSAAMFSLQTIWKISTIR
jgi:hypothetical protein